MKPSTIKRSAKEERERQVLLGLVDYYLTCGKPVGSNTLKETVFKELSSATIRNYFAHLEDEGYLQQLHASGGRIPTEKAYRFYAAENFEFPILDKTAKQQIEKLSREESPEITLFLQKSAETLSEITNCPVFMLAPRFDNDFVLDVKLVMLDVHRCLCVVITNFGLIRTEVLHTDMKLNSFRLKRLENYFSWRQTQHDKPENLEPDEEELAHHWYNEVIVRYVVGYSNFIDDEVYRTGFSRLLSYPEYENPQQLSKALSLFEHIHGMRILLKDCFSVNSLKYWIGKELSTFAEGDPNCTAMAIPYYVNQKPVGAVGLIGPLRIPYRRLFGTLYHFSQIVSEVLTKNIFKYKITYREPIAAPIYLSREDQLLIQQTQSMLIEDKTSKEKEK